MEVGKVRSPNAKFPEVNLKSLLGLILSVLKTDLLTAMGTHRHLSGRLKKFYTLVYWEGRDSWDTEYLCFKKTSVGNSGDEGGYQGRSQLAVLRQRV